MNAAQLTFSDERRRLAASGALGLADDPSVPQRDLLLDGDVVAPYLAPRLGRRGALTIDSCACLHAKYRAGHSLRTAYRLRVDGREHWLAARTFRPERLERVAAKARERAVAGGDLHAAVAVPELGAVFWSFPNDRKIAGLHLLAGGRPLAAMLGRRAIRTELVAWAVEKTATARCLDASGRVVAYAKAYGSGRDGDAAAIHAALAEGGAAAGPRAPRLPALLAHAPADGVLALEALAGERLLALRGDARARGMEHMGVALAILHGLPVPPEAPVFDRLAPHRLRRASATIASAQPAVRAAAGELAELLVATTPADEGPSACLHGDAHPGNALVDGDRLALIDLDLAAAGPASGDLGLVLAGLRQERLTGRLNTAAEKSLGERLLAGYASVRPAPERDVLAWHTAAWLLARPALPGAVAGRMRAATLAHLPALVGAARELVR